jgi:hypothetical protein
MNPKKLKFISDCNTIHQNKYDYSEISYVNAKTKVTIKCKLHGEFSQTPDSHKRGHGCPRCNGGIKDNLDIFIEKSNKIHGGKYDYSLSKYNGTNVKIDIICKIHGLFKQRPNDHLKYGCHTCGIEKRSKTKSLTINEFIMLSNKKHKNTYDYTKVDYVNHKKKIEIICHSHGMFLQTPNSHLNGSGCPICRESHGEKKINLFLTENKINFIRQKKFKDCRNVRPLPFDFYLPEYNLCIEFDGSQHYSLKFRGKSTNKIKYHDKIKTTYCDGINNRPTLLRISYKQSNNIEDILKDYLLIDNLLK